MYVNVKIGILGGDSRQAALARRLSMFGVETAVWGLPTDMDIGDAVRAVRWEDAIEGSKAVILPLPVSKDGENLYAACELPMESLYSALQRDVLVLAGKTDVHIRSAAAEQNFRLLDYFSSEELQIRNAVPTAEGAVEIALRELPITLAQSSVLVLGYGRIGKVLLRILQAMNAYVSVAARRKEDIAYITVNGGNAVLFGSAGFSKAAAESDVIFNTVPAMVLPETALKGLGKCRLIVDLASGNGGTDFQAAKAFGIKTVHALSLPARVAPITAENILCDSILEMLVREGVVCSV